MGSREVGFRREWGAFRREAVPCTKVSRKVGKSTLSRQVFDIFKCVAETESAKLSIEYVHIIP